MMKYTLALLFTLFSLQTIAQDSTKQAKLAQLSGAILTGDSLTAVPYTHVINVSQGTGTTSNIEGYFSLIVGPGDTILFSNVGFKHALYVLPDSFDNRHYTLIQILEADTFMIQEVVLLPWKTYEQLKQAIIDVRLPDDDLQRAKRNLAMVTLKELANNIVNDPGLAVDLSMARQNSYLYNAGRYYGSGGEAVLNALSNPIAWASFIKALKNGDLRNGN